MRSFLLGLGTILGTSSRKREPAKRGLGGGGREGTTNEAEPGKAVKFLNIWRQNREGAKGPVYQDLCELDTCLDACAFAQDHCHPVSTCLGDPFLIDGSDLSVPHPSTSMPPNTHTSNTFIRIPHPPKSRATCSLAQHTPTPPHPQTLGEVWSSL